MQAWRAMASNQVRAEASPWKRGSVRTARMKVS